MAGKKLHIFLIQGEFFAGTVTETKKLPSHNESGKPDSCAGARLLQQPNFLSAECASPGGFWFHRTNFPMKPKKERSRERNAPL